MAIHEHLAVRINPLHMLLAIMAIVANLVLGFVILVKLRTSPETSRTDVLSAMAEIKLSLNEIRESQKNLQPGLEQRIQIEANEAKERVEEKR